jgi:hypothetical protein
MLTGLKDSLASGAVKSLLGGRIERYGRVVELRIHSRERRLSAVLLPAGEREEIAVEIGKYRITGERGAYTVVVEQVSASREWIRLVLEDLLVGRPIPVPSLALLALGGVDSGVDSGETVSSSTSERPS